MGECMEVVVDKDGCVWREREEQKGTLRGGGVQKSSEIRYKRNEALAGNTRTISTTLPSSLPSAPHQGLGSSAGGN